MNKIIPTVLVAALLLFSFYVLNSADKEPDMPGKNWAMQPLSVEFEPLPVNENESIPTTRPNLAIQKVASRGALRFAPENTLAAIQQAIDLDYEYIELDVRYSLDGVPVVIHDWTVDRTTNGTGEINRLTVDEIQTLDAGSWFHYDFRGAKIPTLEEALRLMQGKACFLLDPKEPIRPVTLKLLKEFEFDKDCLIIGFSVIDPSGEPSEMQADILKLWPDAPIMPRIRNENELQFVRAKYPHSVGVHIELMRLTNQLVDAAHAAGLLVITVTAAQKDQPQAYQKAMDVGADLTMLNNIDLFYQYMNIPMDIPKHSLETMVDKKLREAGP